MEVIITIAFLIYIGYREWMHIGHIKSLELKLMAKDTEDYARLRYVDQPENKAERVKAERVNEDLVDPFEVDPGDALKGISK